MIKLSRSVGKRLGQGAYEKKEMHFSTVVTVPITGTVSVYTRPNGKGTSVEVRYDREPIEKSLDKQLGAELEQLTGVVPGGSWFGKKDPEKIYGGHALIGFVSSYGDADYNKG